MVFDRPKRPGKPQPNPATSQPNPATQRSDAQPAKKIITVRSGSGGNGGSRPPGGGGSGGNGGSRPPGGGGNSGNNNPPSPWLIDPGFVPDPSASFVEYLRWMRSPDSDHKDPTKVQILQMAEEWGNYRDRLLQLTERTKLIAGEDNTFQMKCLWRIRVGGHRGPESILLPAFDALGMPYIPASTLRGVARSQAIRELRDQENLSWKRAEEEVSRRYFGFLDGKDEERSGRVIFLDAYPLPEKPEDKGGLAVDMANNIWSWDASGSDLNYSPNPNPFLSLADVVFLIGIRRTRTCDDTTLSQVKQWLIKGLQDGVGSQVNTGYGCLTDRIKTNSNEAFLSIKFALEGQLIHGKHRFSSLESPYFLNKRGKLQPNIKPVPEVRPIAFKSIFRYWFRSFALGFMPSLAVRELEAKLFGSIESQIRSKGWVTFRIAKRKFTPETQTDPAQQKGLLELYCLHQLATRRHLELIQELFQSLSWLATRLGGIGQGARRPCYARSTNPRWRGCNFLLDEQDKFWQVPATIEEFKGAFHTKLQSFHTAVSELIQLEGIRCQVEPIHSPRFVYPTVNQHNWVEAVDGDCKVVAVKGKDRNQKPYSLALLHGQFHQLEQEAHDLKDEKKNREANHKLSEAKSLCGGTVEDEVIVNNEKTKRKAIPSPIWIADLGEYQVVTVFGATQDPRKRYVNELRQRTDRNSFAQIWPFQ